MPPYFAWQGNPWLGLVAGGALAIKPGVAVTTGGTVPVLLRAVGIDPAVADGSILTTVPDKCGFALALGMATLALRSHNEWLANNVIGIVDKIGNSSLLVDRNGTRNRKTMDLVNTRFLSLWLQSRP